MNRNRSTQVPLGTGTWSVTRVGSGLTCTTPISYSIPSYDSSFEEIDETDRGRRNDNFCYHRLYATDIPRTSFSYAVHGATRSNLNYCNYTSNDPDRQFRTHLSGLTPTWGVTGFDGLDSFPAFAQSSQEMLQAKEDGLISMWPRIRAELLSLNSLYELKDFKRLPSLFRRLNTFTDTTKILWHKWRTDPVLRRRHRNLGMSKILAREGIRLGSELYLTKDFALMPLLADVSGIFDALTSYKTQLRKLIDQSGQVRTIYYSRPLTSLFVESDEDFLKSSTGYYDGNRFYRKAERLETPTFRCRMTYSYELPNLSEAQLEVRALLDSLGVNFNPQIIWNALPWSFVVDWLVGVNRWLGNTRVNNIEPIVTIYRYSWSIKASRRVTFKTKYAEGGPNSPTVTNRTYHEYHYYRDTQMPDWAAYVKTSGLNLQEFSYIGALIGARK